jgi:hypothetical protein
MIEDVPFEHSDSGEGDIDIVALHTDAETKYAIKTQKISDVITVIPSLYDLYFNPDRLYVPTAPQDLQLDSFFLYNEIASAKFIADKNASNDNVNRFIWIYGLDKRYSFSRYWDQVRYNIVLTSIAWASDFDPRFCQPGSTEFIKSFLYVSGPFDDGAWMSLVPFGCPQ